MTKNNKTVIVIINKMYPDLLLKYANYKKINKVK